MDQFQELLKQINPQDLMSYIQGINPNQVFGQLGLPPQDTEKIMKGDYSPIMKNDLELIDFDFIFSQNKDKMNINLIRYFFKKAKNKERFTQEEMKAYYIAYENMFNIIFDWAKRFIFTTTEDMSDHNLVIKFEGGHYLLTIIDEMKVITYLKDY